MKHYTIKLIVALLFTVTVSTSMAVTSPSEPSASDIFGAFSRDLHPHVLATLNHETPKTTTHNSHDKAGNKITTVTQTWPGGFQAISKSFYNKQGQLTKTVVTPKINGRKFPPYTTTYNSAGKIETVSKAFHKGSRIGIVTTNYNYNSAGKISEIVSKNNLGTTTKTYNSAGKISEIVSKNNHGVTTTTNYTYNSAGKRSEIVSKNSHGMTTTTNYTYNSAGKILTVSEDTTSRSRSTAAHAGGEFIYTHTTTNTSYAYDSNGNKKITKVVNGGTPQITYLSSAGKAISATTFGTAIQPSAVNATQATPASKSLLPSKNFQSISQGATVTVSKNIDGNNDSNSKFMKQSSSQKQSLPQSNIYSSLRMQRAPGS